MKQKEKITKDEFINLMKESIVPGMFDIAQDADVELNTRISFSTIGNVIKNLLDNIIEDVA